MTTTALFVEVLITGLQALVWIYVLSIAVFGLYRIDVSSLKGWEALTSVFVLALAYSIGIVLDRIVDFSTGGINSRLRRSSILESVSDKSHIVKESDIRDMRLRILIKSSEAAKLLDYTLSRIRVARSFLFNATLTALASFGVLWFRQEVRDEPTLGLVVRLLVVGSILLAAAAFYGWTNLSRTYYCVLVHDYKVLSELNPSVAPLGQVSEAMGGEPVGRKEALLEARPGESEEGSVT